MRRALTWILLTLGALGCSAAPHSTSGAEAGARAPTSSLDASSGIVSSLHDAALMHDAGAIASHFADAATHPAADGGKNATPDGSTTTPTLPPDNGAFDYQLGGAYAPPSGVVTVSRDRNDAPAPGLYNICYVNGFQVQPGEDAQWDADLILRDAQGQPVIDTDWNEALLDTSTADKRTRIATKLGTWIDGCRKSGFDAVEVDNLDSYSRSGNRLTQDGAVALLALLSARAHAAGLAIAQKNTTELVSRRAEMGTDFAVAEECNRYSECDQYIAAYGKHVLMIEYRDADFSQGCAKYGADYAIVRRDLDLVTPSDPAYHYQGC